MTTDIFSNEQHRPRLDGLRICLAGVFSVPSANIKKQLISLGASKVDVVIKGSKEEMNSLPAKENTNIFVVGKDAPLDCVARYELNCHDGYIAVKLNEAELLSFINGDLHLEIPNPIVKHVNLDYSYYNWTAPANQMSHKSSPFLYDMNSVHSPVYGHELFIPDMDGINTIALGQIVGNLGGFSNNQNLPNTDMVMLSESTVENLKRGIKDSVILKIEKDYNNGTSKMFSCCFTCVSNFLKWVDFRLSQCPDPSTQALMDRLYES